jgi:hypothetical protein
MSEISRAFAPLGSRPCWNVKPGLGTFLTFEFGDPHLVIREPVAPNSAVSANVQRALARRISYARGEWHFWIYCCAWQVFDGERPVGDWSSKAGIRRAATFLNGQKLISAALGKRGARTEFSFDLGGRLLTKPYDRTSEQWLLFEPKDRVLVWRADRRYSHGASTGEQKAVWKRPN